MKFNCKKCGELDMIYLDGGYVDNSLKGIKFEVKDKNGTPRVNMREQDKRFYSNDVVKEYEQMAQNFAMELMLGECPKCQEEINTGYFQKVKDDEIATKMADEQAKQVTFNKTRQNLSPS